MPRHARVKSGSDVYHVIWRGASRQVVFHDDEDCRVFLDTIGKYKEKSGLRVYGWCLMSNHIHLLLKEGDESLSVTMKRIGVSFVGYYNWKYRTTGHLFQGRFKSENVETRGYLLTAIRYIHQNPVKAGIVECVDGWKWSSCLGYYTNNVYPRGLLDDSLILGLFSANKTTAIEEFKAFNEKKNDDQCLEDHTKSRLTDEEAGEKIKELLGTIEIAQVKSLLRLQRNDILREIKKIDGLSQRQTARILGISPSLVFKA